MFVDPATVSPSVKYFLMTTVSEGVGLGGQWIGSLPSLLSPPFKSCAAHCSFPLSLLSCQLLSLFSCFALHFLHITNRSVKLMQIILDTWEHKSFGIRKETSENQSFLCTIVVCCSALSFENVCKNLHLSAVSCFLSSSVFRVTF